MQGSASHSRGFTLIELMIVVAIIGLLAAIAIPNFNRFQSRTKQSEAKVNLRAIYTLARSYFAEHDTFDAGFDKLVFSPEGNNRYTYTYTAPSGGTTAIVGSRGGACAAGLTSTVTPSSFSATACGNIDNDPFIDSWVIDQAGIMANGTSANATDGSDIVN